MPFGPAHHSPEPLVLSPVEMDTGVVLLKSDVYEVYSDLWVWDARHPSGWWRQGTADDVIGAQEAAEAALTEALESAGYQVRPPRGTVQITQLHYDMPRPNPPWTPSQPPLDSGGSLPI